MSTDFPSIVAPRGISALTRSRRSSSLPQLGLRAQRAPGAFYAEGGMTRIARQDVLTPQNMVPDYLNMAMGFDEGGYATMDDVKPLWMARNRDMAMRAMRTLPQSAQLTMAAQPGFNPDTAGPAIDEYRANTNPWTAGIAPGLREAPMRALNYANPFADSDNGDLLTDELSTLALGPGLGKIARVAGMPRIAKFLDVPLRPHAWAWPGSEEGKMVSWPRIKQALLPMGAFDAATRSLGSKEH